MDPTIPERLENLKKLDETERAIVDLLCEGLNVPQIADKVHLGVSTVRNIQSDIFKKLKIEERPPKVGEDRRERKRNDLKRLYCGLPKEGSEGLEEKPIPAPEIFYPKREEPKREEPKPPRLEPQREPEIFVPPPAPRRVQAPTRVERQGSQMALIVFAVVMAGIICVGMLVNNGQNQAQSTPTPSSTNRPTATLQIIRLPTTIPTITLPPPKPPTPSWTPTFEGFTFEDNFDNKISDEWIVEGTPPYVTDGFLRAEPLYENPSAIYYGVGNKTLKNYSVLFIGRSLEKRSTSSAPQASISNVIEFYFRMTDFDSDWLAFFCFWEKCELVVNLEGDSRAPQLGDNIDAKWDNELRSYQINVIDNDITFLVDSRQVMSYSLPPEYAKHFTYGGISIYFADNEAEFDKVILKTLP